MQFIERIGKDNSEAAQFNVFRIRDLDASATSPHNRRDFYKMSLITQAHGTLFHADRSILIDAPALVFSNPMIPYSWERLVGTEDGYFCLFTEAFIDPHLKEGGLSQSPLFKVRGNPVLFPDPGTVDLLLTIYTRMEAGINMDYPNKYELLRAYVQVVLHESLKSRRMKCSIRRLPPHSGSAHFFWNYSSGSSPFLRIAIPSSSKMPMNMQNNWPSIPII